MLSRSVENDCHPDLKMFCFQFFVTENVDLHLQCMKNYCSIGRSGFGQNSSKAVVVNDFSRIFQNLISAKKCVMRLVIFIFEMSTP